MTLTTDAPDTAATVRELKSVVFDLRALVAELQQKVAALEAERKPRIRQYPEPTLPSTAEDVNSIAYPFGVGARREWL